jgi:hypothetical protein
VNASTLDSSVEQHLKLWLDPIALAANHAFSAHELSETRRTLKRS